MNKFLYITATVLLTAIAGCKSSQQYKTARNDRSMTMPAFNKEGHRGTRGLMPENTIVAMQKAVDLGVNTVEMDVVISGDRKVVISHDLYFNPDITTNPDGSYIDKKEAQNYLLYNMSYDSIKKYDVGLKPYKSFPEQQKIAAFKPLLSDLLDETDAYAARQGKTVMYNIEIKSDPKYDGIQQPPIEETVDLVMEVVRSKKIDGRYYLQSFDFRPLQILHKKYPTVVTAVLIGGNEKRTLDEQIENLGYTPEMYSPNYTLVTAELVAECHKKGMKIIPWTINTVDGMKKMKALGVDGIITDYPNYFSEL